VVGARRCPSGPGQLAVGLQSAIGRKNWGQNTDSFLPSACEAPHPSVQPRDPRHPPSPALLATSWLMSMCRGVRPPTRRFMGGVSERPPPCGPGALPHVIQLHPLFPSTGEDTRM